MKKNEVQVGATYLVKVSGRVQPVTLVRESEHGGWVGKNESTGRTVRVRSAAKLRRLYVAAPTPIPGKTVTEQDPRAVHESDRFYGDGRDSDFETDA